ncbi:MAG TPA: protease modulator HflK [Verrucomicrobiae bacterium]|jgi:membrane protease subunit HflK|nr:protease modulator HflK [Verrucomicrobiae bacterium]
MNEHSHPHDEHEHPHSPETHVDSGSQALTEALRSSFVIVRFVMVLLVLVFLSSGFFKVEPNERAIILRFGKPLGVGEKALLGPGLHWSFPYPIDEVVKVSVTGIQKVASSVGWYAVTPEQELAGTEPPAGPSLNPAIDGYTITADANIVHVRSTLYFRIEDPVRYTFGFVNASNMVRNALNNAVVYAAANYKVDDILTRDKAGFQEAVRRHATELLDKENIGVAVDQCDVQTTWPRQQKVSDAFVAVLNAQINRDRALQEASSYTNQVLTAAQANSNAIVNLAESDRAQLISDLASRSSNFVSILPWYRTNKDLFVVQQFNQTMGRVLTNVQEKIYVAERADGKPRDLWLQLNREPPKPSTATTNQ